MIWHEKLTLLIPAVTGPRPVGLFARPEELCETLELFLLATNYYHKRPSDFAGVIIGLNQEYARQAHPGRLDSDYLVGRWKRFFIQGKTELFDDTLRLAVLKRDSQACSYCGYEKKLHVHHVIPQKLHGPNNLINLVACCESCNWDIGSTIRIPKNWWTLHPDSTNAPKT